MSNNPEFIAAMKEWHAKQARIARVRKAYYKGGHKTTFDGVPCRLAMEPTKHMLALMRWDDYRVCKALRDMAGTRYPQTHYIETAMADLGDALAAMARDLPKIAARRDADGDHVRDAFRAAA